MISLSDGFIRMFILYVLTILTCSRHLNTSVPIVELKKNILLHMRASVNEQPYTKETLSKNVGY